MAFRRGIRRVGGIIAVTLTLQASGLVTNMAFASEGTPNVVVIPFLSGEGATDKQAQKFTALVVDDLKGRDESLSVVALPAGTRVKDSPSAKASASGGSSSAATVQKALELLNEGQQDLQDLKFEDAAATLQKGADLMLSEPGSALYDKVLDAYISIAVAYFRTGDEKKAQNALLTVARLAPDYTLPTDKYPPVFTRELDKAKRRADKAVKGTVTIDGPSGATAYLDGKDLGMVPVTQENVVVGMHYVKVEGNHGEKYGQPLDLKGSSAKVKAVFAPGPQSVASEEPPASPGSPITSPVLDANSTYRLIQLCKAAGAEFAVVGYVYRSSEHQLSANTALFSLKKQAYSVISSSPFDDELLTANVEAFKLGDQLASRLTKFEAISVPHSLAAHNGQAYVARTEGKGQSKESGEVNAEVTTRKGTTVASNEGTRKPVKADSDVPKANDSDTNADGIHALRNRSVVEDGAPTSVDGDIIGPIKKRKDDKVEEGGGIAWWVWAVAGVAVAGAAGGTYYGISQATKPVTGTVSAKW